jgi:hypothetical protein
MLKQNKAHKATQTIKERLHTMDKTGRGGEVKAIPVTGHAGL